MLIVLAYPQTSLCEGRVILLSSATDEAGKNCEREYKEELALLLEDMSVLQVFTDERISADMSRNSVSAADSALIRRILGNNNAIGVLQLNGDACNIHTLRIYFECGAQLLERTLTFEFQATVIEASR